MSLMNRACLALKARYNQCSGQTRAVPSPTHPKVLHAHSTTEFALARQIVYTTLVELEWDDSKNRQNIRKHRVEFEIAERFFSNPHLERVDDRQDYGEERLIALGEVEGIVFVVVYTTITATVYRIISIRKALKHEKETYYEWRFQEGR